MARIYFFKYPHTINGEWHDPINSFSVKFSNDIPTASSSGTVLSSVTSDYYVETIGGYEYWWMDIPDSYIGKYTYFGFIRLNLKDGYNIVQGSGKIISSDSQTTPNFNNADSFNVWPTTDTTHSGSYLNLEDKYYYLDCNFTYQDIKPSLTNITNGTCYTDGSITFTAYGKNLSGQKIIFDLNDFYVSQKTANYDDYITYQFSPSSVSTGWYIGNNTIAASLSSDSSQKVSNIFSIQLPSVVLGKDTLTLEVGNSETLTKTIKSGSSTKQISWSSDNSDIAKVDTAGKVTAISPGVTTITITLFNGEDYYSDQCTVTVKGNIISVEGVTLNRTTATLIGSENFTLQAIVEPDNATNKNVTWTSSNTNVATVLNGIVTAKSAGTATITVKTVDGSKTATCIVTVLNPDNLKIVLSGANTPTYSDGKTSYTLTPQMQYNGNLVQEKQFSYIWFLDDVQQNTTGWSGGKEFKFTTGGTYKITIKAETYTSISETNINLDVVIKIYHKNVKVPRYHTFAGSPTGGVDCINSVTLTAYAPDDSNMKNSLGQIYFAKGTGDYWEPTTPYLLLAKNSTYIWKPNISLNLNTGYGNLILASKYSDTVNDKFIVYDKDDETRNNQAVSVINGFNFGGFALSSPEWILDFTVQKASNVKTGDLYVEVNGVRKRLMVYKINNDGTQTLIGHLVAK